MAGPTIAQLGMRIDSSEAGKATAALGSLTVAGGKTEAATQRLTRRMALLEIEARGVDAGLGKTSREMALLEIEARKMDAALRANSNALRANAAASEGVGRQASQLERGLAVLGAAFAAHKLVQYGRETIALADAYTNLHSRLGLVTTGVANLASVEARLFGVSNQTRTSVESNVALYASLARSTKALGLGQQELIGITRTVSQSFLISGASASETNAAVRQLSQALASGVLRGDEFNSIAENAPRLQQAIAESLGVTTGRLRAMAAEGKITAEVITSALLKSGASIDAEFKRIPVTVGGAMTQVRNDLLLYVGEVNKATHATQGLVVGLQWLRDNGAAVATSLAGVAAAAGLLKLGAVGATIAFTEFVVAGFSVSAMLGTLALAAAPITLLAAGFALLVAAVKDAQLETELYNREIREAAATSRVMQAIHYRMAEGLEKARKFYPDVYGPAKKVIAEATAEQKKAAASLLDVVNAGTLARVTAQREFEAVGMATDARALYNLETERQLAVMRAEQSLSGEALRRQLLQIKHTFDLREATILLDNAQKERDRAAVLRLANQKEENESLLRQTNRVRALADAWTKAALAGVAAQTDRIQSRFALAGGGTAPQEVIDARKYADDMHDLWRQSAGRIAADFVKSFARGFEEVYSLAVRLMSRMEEEFKKNGKALGLAYQGLKFGAAAIGGGLAGYSAGQAIGAAGGGAAMGALGGAASGAAAGAAFGPWGAAIGGLVGAAAGLFGASQAQKEAAKLMMEARKNVRLTLTGAESDLRGDALGTGIARIKAESETIRKAIEDAFSGGDRYSEQVRQRNVELGRLASVEAQRIAQLQAEIALKVRQITEDVQIQILRNNGALAEADALARQVDQERRFADLRKAGIDEATIAALALSEAAKNAREAAVAAREAFRAMEDLDVRMLRATGFGSQADGAAFRNQQQREFEDARFAGRSAEYLALLTAVQVQEAIQRAQLIENERQTTLLRDAADAEQRRFDEQIKLTSDALRVAEDQLRAQEQAVAATQRVVETLTQFAAGLSLNKSLTILSPIAQMAEAKKQFDTLLAQANAGNKDAAGNLPGAANAFLTASQAVNATGPAYVKDFLRVQAAIEAVTSRYGAQLTTEQQILAAIQSQVSTLQAQLATLQAAKDAAAQQSAAQIAAINASSDNFRAAIEGWRPPQTPLPPPTSPFAPDYVGLGLFDSTVSSLERSIDTPRLSTRDTQQDAILTELRTSNETLDEMNEQQATTIARLETSVRVLQEGFTRLLETGATRDDIARLTDEIRSGNESQAARTYAT